MERDRSMEGAGTHRRVAWIVVRGEFGPLLAAALPECDIEAAAGRTRLTVVVRDEAELFGVLGRLRDFGAELVSVSTES